MTDSNSEVSGSSHSLFTFPDTFFSLAFRYYSMSRIERELPTPIMRMPSITGPVCMIEFTLGEVNLT